MDGEANMRWDRETLAAVHQGAQGPTGRLFRFSEPTMTYGRLQQAASIRAVAPAGWPLVQRPTAGGAVRHDGDLCLSLCWRYGTAPMPTSPRAIYHWIHTRLLDALQDAGDLHLATCAETPRPAAGMDRRQCFQEPVGYDVMRGAAKIAGGAMAFQKNAVLYQGSIQTVDIERTADALRRVFSAFLL